ncbi:calcium uptake protein 3, mitochondrial isoform X2 [Halyomorpha halys]|uniref:calcium uptake protein 3, mitochondrial isoform X2 n=1 Tax=Halyomorpha halys TaxID=286706 RepID=UPI0006D50414|nr:calcium uptake protein 3, mitochondrial isoform X2 [Halyomorpha halys]
MGTVRRLCPLRISENGLFRLFRRNHHDAPTYLRARRAKKATAALAVGGIALYSLLKLNHLDYTVHAFKKGIKKEEEEQVKAKVVKLTSRERRFLKFASVKHDGQIYMTPKDFLESFIHEEPIPVRERRELSEKELESLRKSTPVLSAGSSHLFRNLEDNGIISYTEYLFLISILTKPLSGFRIAFNMFDTDGNERVDKNEFLVMEKIFSHAWKDKRGLGVDGNMLQVEGSATADYVDDDQGLQRRHNVDTTLAVHFFGTKGNQDLKYEGFRKFMDDLQTEVLEIEFQEYAKGNDTISEVDFAKIMLRYTQLSAEDHGQYLERLMTRVKDSMPGITFGEFKVFCQFLNNLEDFTIAMRMYTLADHPISKDEFHRAVMICTGTSLSRHLVHTVFAIFDEDGDGQLSYREFIAIMKDRLHRGFKTNTKSEGWDAFKHCVKQELKNPAKKSREDEKNKKVRNKEALKYVF